MWLHVLRRDVRHTRWFWLAMALTLTALCALPDVAFARMDHGRGTQALTTVFMVLCLAHGCAAVALVWRLVSEDALLRETAFWRGRPLAPGAVLGAKVVYGLLFVVVAPVVVSLPWAWGLERDVAWFGIRQVALTQSVLLAVALPVAVLSRRILVGLVVVAGVYVALAWAGVSTFTPYALTIARELTYFKHDVLVTRVWVAVALFAGAVGWAVWRAYRRGGQRAGLVVIGAALAASVAVQAWWPWGLVPKKWSAPGPSNAYESPAAKAELRVEFYGSKYPSLGPFLWATVKRESAENNLWRIVRVEVTRRNGDGAVTKRYPVYEGMNVELGRGPELFSWGKLPNWAKVENNEVWFPVEELEAEPAECRVRMTFEESVFRERTVALTEDSRSGMRGDELRLVSLSVRDTQATVQVVDQTRLDLPDRLVARDRVFLLVNDRRKEALSAQHGGQDFSAFYLRTSEWTMTFDARELREMSREAWREWLSEARLVRLTYEPRRVFAVEIGPVTVPARR